jgi:hypothetical protein
VPGNKAGFVTVFKLADSAGVYLTDEVFLYRVVGEPSDAVELEDCYGLDVVRVPADELSARRLRLVTPAGPGPRE